MTASFETLLWDVDADGVLVLALDRPARRNAFTLQMAADLEAAFTRASLDDQVRVIVLAAEGTHFCVGMDLGGEGNPFGLDADQRPTLRDLRERFDDPAIVAGVRDTGGRVTLAMLACRKPIVAAINGIAVGIGATMILAADFRFAAHHARFGYVFGTIGITPEACSTWLLPRLVGIEQALEWCYTGRIFDAPEALDKGLVRAICAPADLLEEARSFARSLVAGRSPVAIALTRQMLWRSAAIADPEEAHRIESLSVFHTSQADGAEGVAAFREKRAPRFAGRASAMPDFYPWW